jgi:hypothetical protein
MVGTSKFQYTVWLRLDNWAKGVRSPIEAKNFSSSLCAQTSSCPVGTGVPFPGGKACPGRDADHLPPSSAEVNNDYEIYALSSLSPACR